MKRTIYSLYIDVPENEHFGKSIGGKYDTVDKPSYKITRNAFKEHYHKLIKCKKDYEELLERLFICLNMIKTIKHFQIIY